MKKPNRKTPFVFYLSLVLLFAFLISIYAVSGLYARFAAGDDDSDSARVAKFDFEITQVGDGDVDGLTFEVAFENGEPQDYSFTVSNNSEVVVRYVIRVENLTENLPLQITYTPSESGVIDIGQKTDVTVCIDWETDNVSPEYSGMVDLLRFVLAVEQVD